MLTAVRLEYVGAELFLNPVRREPARRFAEPSGRFFAKGIFTLETSVAATGTVESLGLNMTGLPTVIEYRRDDDGASLRLAAG